MIRRIIVGYPSFLILLLLSATMSCKESGNIELPQDEMIDRQKMIQLLADMEITEAALRMKQSKIGRDSLESISNRAYDSLYLYYKVTPEMFYKNLKYYQNNMETYEAMMEEKITLLSKKKDSISMEKRDSDTLSISKKATL